MKQGMAVRSVTGPAAATRKKVDPATGSAFRTASEGVPEQLENRQTELRKLLVLQGPSLEAGGIVSLLQQYFEVKVTDRFEDALDAMREDRFHAVLAETADFLPIERGVVSQQAAAVLDTVGDGVCVCDAEGRAVWANRRAKGFPEALMRQVSEACREAHRQFSGQGASAAGHSRRASAASPGDGRSYEVICSPIRDAEQQLRQVVAVVMDVTHQRRQQMKLNALDRAGRELVSLGEQSASQPDAQARLRVLEDRVLSCSKDLLNYEHFAIMLLDRSTSRLEMLVAEGLADEVADYQLLASTEGSGICGYVAATGRSYICPDVAGDAHYITGVRDARSSLTVPLRLHDRIVGVLNVESHRPGAFDEEDRQFAETFGNYIALALHILNLLATERYSAHTQVSGSLCVDLAGPINDVITEASEAMEDYIGHDDLRKRLQRIIERASHARTLVRDYSKSPAAGVVRAPAVNFDPVLSGKRVLVADDEQMMRETVRDVLAACGAVVDVAEDGAQAVAMIAKCSYDLVISDVKMPGASGYEVFSAVRAASTDTGVILMTGFGYDPNHSIVKANRDGLRAVLSKPFRANRLVEECRSALER
jgi:CheY-like chemotaxis protein